MCLYPYIFVYLNPASNIFTTYFHPDAEKEDPKGEGLQN